jgi:putative transposase
MLIYEYKVDGKPQQYSAIEEAIRVVQFIRNKCLRIWMDGAATTAHDLQWYSAVLAKHYPFVLHLNSQARQASADRAWFAISRFYKHCREHTPGKKGYPTFQHDNRSVEWKQTGWKLDQDGKHITFTDGCGIGRLRLVGTRDLATQPRLAIQRVRIVRRAAGYFVQFGVKRERRTRHQPTGQQLGIDVGLKVYYTDSQGKSVENPRYYRRAEKRLKRLHRQVSRKTKGSHNRKKARKRLAKASLTVQRQREDFARKTANALITSSDLIAFEDLKIGNLVKNKHLAKSIYDAGWGTFLTWVKAYGAIHDIVVMAVSPHFTSQACSRCGMKVKKSLSVRTHVCPSCELVMDRDENAAHNILQKALRTLGHRETDPLSGGETLLDIRPLLAGSEESASKLDG